MDREIKFRGKDKKGKWHYGYFWKSPDNCYWIKENGEDFKIISKTLGQSTELEDKNGKEIYEGDIVKAYIDENYEIKYCRASFSEVLAFHPVSKDDMHYNEYYGYWHGNEFEIIGNIYENKELIK